MNYSGGFKKIFWVLVMTGMAAALMYSVLQLTLKYSDYSVNVKLSVDHQPQLTFPAVTVCNMSPVKKSSLEAAQKSATAKRRKKRSGRAEFRFSPHILFSREIMHFVTYRFFLIHSDKIPDK